MHALERPRDEDASPYCFSLSTFKPGTAGIVVSVGTHGQEIGAIERRLIELGFIAGERVQVIAEARPGRDPFVVRIGQTMLALRRREAQSIWVEPVQS